jgi:hypothetical protein
VDIAARSRSLARYVLSVQERLDELAGGDHDFERHLACPINLRDALDAILERAAPGPSFVFDARAIRASDMHGEVRVGLVSVSILVSFGEHDGLVVSCRPNRPSKRRRRSARRREMSSRPDRPDRPRTGRDVGRRTRAPAGRHAPC